MRVASATEFSMASFNQNRMAEPNRTVVPLPTALDRRPFTPDDLRNMTALAHTFSSQSRANVSGVTRHSSKKQPKESRSWCGETSLLNQSLLAADAQCCPTDTKRMDATRPNGLFVTFCHQGADEMIAATQRELEYERSLRETDHHFQEVELVKVLRQLKQAEFDRDAALAQVAALQSQRATENAEYLMVRTELERRWNEACAALNAMTIDRDQWKTNCEQHRIAENNRSHEATMASRGATEMKAALTQLEQESAANAQRALLYFEEKRTLQKTVDSLRTELRRVQDTLSAKELLIRGLDKELLHVNERLTSASMLRKHRSIPVDEGISKTRQRLERATNAL